MEKVTNEVPMETINNFHSQVVENLPNESQVKTDMDMLNEFKSNPENILKAQVMASQMRDEVSKNWFTIAQVCKKFQLKFEEAQNKILMLNIFGLIATKAEKGNQLFKIDLNSDVQRNLIRLEMESLEIKMKYLKEKLIELN